MHICKMEGMGVTISVGATMSRGTTTPLYAMNGTERSGAFAGYMQRLNRGALPVVSRSCWKRSGVGNIASWIGGLTQLRE